MVNKKCIYQQLSMLVIETSPLKAFCIIYVCNNAFTYVYAYDMRTLYGTC